MATSKKTEGATLEQARTLAAQNRLGEARDLCELLAAEQPRNHAVWDLLATVSVGLHEYDRAVASFKEAIRIDPTNARLQATKDHALMLARHGRLEHALSLFCEVCERMPEDIHAWYVRGSLHGGLGQYREAIECCNHVLRLNPAHDAAEVNLGHVYLHQGETAEALQHYRRAAEINPGNIVALMNLGKACRGWDDIAQYLRLYRAALDVVPDPTETRRVFVEVIADTQPPRYDAWLDEELQRCFALDGIEYRTLVRVSARLLELKYPDAFRTDQTSADLRARASRLAQDRLLVLVLEKVINNYPELERWLTRLRRELFVAYRESGAIDTGTLPIVTALSWQGHNNEYVFARDDQEEQWIDALRRDIEDRTPSQATPTPELEQRLLVFAMYEGLATLACREHLNAMTPEDWSKPFRRLLKEALSNRLIELKLKDEIPALSSISDETSRLVRSQYEENPYPRWTSLPIRQEKNLRQVLGTEFPHFTAPAFLDGPIRILVAGCGTGRQPLQTAVTYKNAEVLAVDISKSSLAYALRMARRHDVRNVRFMQADILELAQLEQRFHVIECSGVLHHMENPLAGWRVLVDLLVDNGLMSVALYSELGRKSVVAAREAISRMGLKPNSTDIRRFRDSLLRNDSDELLKTLTMNQEFYSTSACRDLLFHYMEHRYTVPRIDAEMRELGLRFLGFTFHDPRVKASYRTEFPDDREMTNLANWDRYENSHPNTFSRMYSFWCQHIPTTRELPRDYGSHDG